MSKKKKSQSKPISRRKAIAPPKKENNKLIWIIAGIGLMALIAISAVFFLERNGARDASAAARLPAEISVDQAAAKREQGAFILDVREPQEWQEYHIPGSTLIPLGELPNRLSEVPKDREIVVVCRSGNRSRTGSEILAKNGFSRVTSMAGGLKEWAAKGYETVSGP